MHYLTFLLSGFRIVIAGIYLARSADTIAEKTGLGRMLVGSLILAGATSLTELFVGYNAVTSGDAQLAMGNLIGACLVNLIILSIADFIHKDKPTNKFSRASASHALVGSIFIILMIITTMSIFLADKVKDITLGNAGIGSWAILVTFVATVKVIFKNQQSLEKGKGGKKRRDLSFKSLTPCFLLFIVCAVAIGVASPFLVASAEQISAETGLETSFIGMTLVALTTSLPELVSTIQAVRMGAYELALGNILGSNIYNIVLIAVLDFFPRDSIFSATPYFLIFSCLGTVLATSVAIVGQLYQVERVKKKTFELDASAILGIVLLSLFVTFRFA